MTPSSKAKVRTDAELALLSKLIEGDILKSYIATIDALKADVDDLTETNQDLRQSRDLLEAELALKDKVVEAARNLMIYAPYAKTPRWITMRTALNDLDKVMAR